MTDDSPGVLYVIWQNDESRCVIAPEDAPLVDRAMKLWADSAQTRDTWLSLTTVDGATFNVLASTITSTMRSTPEQRRAGVFHDKAVEDERALNRRDAGYVESE